MSQQGGHFLPPGVQRDRSLSMYTLMARSGRQSAKELFLRLSREDPVHWDPYAGVWLVAGRAEALTVCVDERFTALRLSGSGPRSTALSDEVRQRVDHAISRQALFLDGAAHAEWRRVIRRVVSADRVAALAPWIRRRVSELIEAGGPGRLDVVGDLARPLPLEAIARLLGLPVADLPMISKWSDAYTQLVTGFEPVTAPLVFAQVSAFLDYAEELVRLRRGSPTDDGAGILVAAADETGSFSDLDIASNLVMLIAAGHQTTTGFLSGAVLRSLGPDSNCPPPGGWSDSAVEDLLAEVSPSRFVGRRVTADVELAGKTLRAGQAVLVLLAAVNWAEREAPAVRAHGHAAFGLGRHHCPGAQLARLEGRLVLDGLFGTEHRPVMSDADIEWTDNVNLPCPEHVEVLLAEQ